MNKSKKVNPILDAIYAADGEKWVNLSVWHVSPDSLKHFQLLNNFEPLNPFAPDLPVIKGKRLVGAIILGDDFIPIIIDTQVHGAEWRTSTGEIMTIIGFNDNE